MRRLFILTILLCCAHICSAQKLDPAYYDYPLRNVAGYYSANFGEMRPNHFHAGTDFKTDGVEGKPVVAVADGYVSRVSQSPTGYGLALYVTHPNGTTSVYGHLSRFRKDIADFVFSERHRLKQSRVDLYCQADQFPVKRGEEIARSGNTGSSQGPHLHFEIRDAKTQKTLNIISQGIVTPKDNISPYIMKVHYVEVDTVRGVPCHSRLATYAVHKADANTYRTAQKSPIKVGRKGYFIVETSDRKNDVANTYGVYNMVAKLDGKAIFEYRNDGFPFDLSRYCNAVSHYPIQRRSRNEVMRAAMLQGGTKYFYPTLVNRGVVTTAEGEERKMEFVITDDCGNTSTLAFDIAGKSNDACFKGEVAEDAIIVEYNRDFAHKVDDVLSVVIAKGSLYESIALDIERSDVAIKADSTIKVLSPAYRIHDDNTPLQKSIGLVFTQDVEERLQPYTVMASVSSGGYLYYSGGRYRHNRLTARTSSFGTFCLVADMTPPTIRPQFEDGQDCRGRDRIAFRLSDNFSGVSSYNVYIDGKWVAIDYARSRAWVNLKAEGISGGKSHNIEIVVKDACGNTAKWQGTIIR
ncbi:MAG: M23 family metallopeptidase [Rikenellaceae bacterium]|nr:M23 family metallopeptidase [Rikenellaceae bacterium]